MPNEGGSGDANNRAAFQQDLSAATRRATGPRTKAGKDRARRNALKSGLFATTLLVPGESPAEYETLRAGLWEEHRPKSTSEAEDVVYLAQLYWSRRRIARAESAEITKAIVFTDVDSTDEKMNEAWELSRAGNTAGGLLRRSSNRFVVQEAVAQLKFFRHLFGIVGFVEGLIPRPLIKVYGFEDDNRAPLDSLSHVFEVFQVLASHARAGHKIGQSPEQMKRTMLEALDEQIELLKRLEAELRVNDTVRAELQKDAALVPPQEVVDRIIRVRAHLSREIDRTLDRLGPKRDETVNHR